MIVVVDGREYESIYFPYYRLEKNESFSVFGIRYPSGFTEEVLVFDVDNHIVELKEYSKFLIKEYAFEDDDMLTERARRLKNDVKKLFGIE
jgi:hypothetical protein